MPLSPSRKASLIRLFVFFLMGILWLGVMYLTINGFVWARSDIQISEIMSATGDIATVLAFVMVYMSNPFLNKPSVDIEGLTHKSSFKADVKKQFFAFLYNAFSYILAWHAVVAVLLRSDLTNFFIMGMTKKLLTASILISFFATALLLRKGYKEGRAEAKSNED